MNFDDIPAEVIVARGKYSTVRGAHEDAKKQLSVLCGRLSSVSSQVLRYMQPANDDAPQMAAVHDLMQMGREYLDDIDACIVQINELDAQRSALKPEAWGK